MTKSLGIDEKATAEKNKSNYYSRMKRNKYWRKGWRAAKKGLSKFDDNPFTLPEDVIKLLRKRTFWLMGFEEFDLSKYGKRKRKKEAKKKSDVKVYDISKLKSSGKWKEKRKHGKHKHKHKHKR